MSNKSTFTECQEKVVKSAAKQTVSRPADIDHIAHQINQDSPVISSQWTIGKSIRHEVNGCKIYRLVDQVSQVNPIWLTEVAPHLLEQKSRLNPKYDAAKDTIISTTETFLNGTLIMEKAVDDPDHPNATEILAEWLAKATITNSVTHKVIQANHARQNKAKDLNRRVGDDIFKFSTQPEISEFYLAALAGARRFSEIPDTKALLLPALDKQDVAKVMSGYPDKIEVAGQLRDVKYSKICQFVEMDHEPYIEIRSNDLKSIPDGRIYLPSGRPVQLADSETGFMMTIYHKTGYECKEAFRKLLNDITWGKAWRHADEMLPLFDRKTHIVVPVVTIEYGKDALTDEPLIKYGTLAERTGKVFSKEWYDNPEKAEQIRQKAQATIDELTGRPNPPEND
jgi:hypothetical protein